MRHIRFVRLAIKDSHRGLAIQLRDGGSISDVTFEHVSVSTRLYDPSWWGAAEPISITAVPRTPGGQVRCRAAGRGALGRHGCACAHVRLNRPSSRTCPHTPSLPPSQVGTVSDVAFRDITAVSEGGILLAGGPLGGDAAPSAAAAAADGDACGASGCVTAEQRRQQPYSLQRITLERVRVQLKQRSRWPGGCRDYRPSSNDSGTPSPCAACEGWWPAGLDCAGRKTAPLWVAGAEGVVLHDLRLQHHAPWRADWSGEAWIDPASTRYVLCAAAACCCCCGAVLACSLRLLRLLTHMPLSALLPLSPAGTCRSGTCPSPMPTSGGRPTMGRQRSNGRARLVPTPRLHTRSNFSPHFHIPGPASAPVCIAPRPLKAPLWSWAHP